MLVSTKGRYALRVMIDLAQHYTDKKKYIPLGIIAEKENISEKYLESIIVVLSRANFVDGVRGKGGGYRLIKEPSEYTVGSILRTVEGTIAPINCLKTDINHCERTDECKTLPMWTELGKIINDYLDTVKLSDFLE